MSGGRLRGGALAIAAIVLLSALFLLSRPSDPGAHARIVDLLGGLREGEEMLGRLVLEIGTRRLLTYDPILSTEQNLEQSLAALRSDPAMQAESEAKLLDRYAGIVKDRRRAVERFETADAVYHNSSLSLPLLTHEVGSRMRASGQQDIADAIIDWDQTLFLRLHGRVPESDLAAAALRLDTLSADRPEARRDIELLETHSQVLVRGQEAANVLVGRILDLSRGDLLSEIYRVYMAGHVAEDGRAGQVLYALYAAAFLCVLGLVAMVVKLGRTTESFAGANRLLSERAAELERLSAELQREIEQRRAAQAMLQSHRTDLEHEISERTSDLFASEARLVDAIETLPEAFVLWDAENRLVVCNAAYRALACITEEEAARGISHWEVNRRAWQRGFFDIKSEDTEAYWQGVTAHVHSISNDIVSYETRFSDGRWIQSQERRTRDGGFVSLLIDVTASRRREELLAERNKLTALGQLAGGVAHEINNLLQPALIFPELVRDRLPPEDVESREELDIVLDSVRKAREVVRNILLFSRKQEPTLETVNLAAEIDTALNFVRDLMPPEIALHRHIDPLAAMAAVNRTQLTQVLTNLVLNAVHASDGHGAIEVTLSQTRPTAGEAETLAITAGTAYLTLTVADHGTGMDAETMAHIFEPFFTTKPVGEGTGLGLSVVFGILRSWSGAIAVESTLGSGTAFTLYIPMAGDDRPAKASTPIAA